MVKDLTPNSDGEDGEGPADSERAYNRAVRLLSARARSTEEIRRRLRGARYDSDVIEAVVSRLTDEGFLNDTSFAESWVEWRTGSKPKSRSAIRRELMAMGVAAEEVETAVSAVDEEVEYENAARLATARLRRLTALPVEAQRQRLATFLRARGYSWDLVRKVLTDILGDD